MLYRRCILSHKSAAGCISSLAPLSLAGGNGALNFFVSLHSRTTQLKELACCAAFRSVLTLPAQRPSSSSAPGGLKFYQEGSSPGFLHVRQSWSAVPVQIVSSPDLNVVVTDERLSPKPHRVIGHSYRTSHARSFEPVSTSLSAHSSNRSAWCLHITGLRVSEAARLSCLQTRNDLA